MNPSRALSLFAAPALSMLMMLGCNAQVDEVDQASPDAAQLEQHSTSSICDPRTGLHGQMWQVQSTYSQYMYRNGWCSVGTRLPAMCFQGRYYYQQQPVSQYCASVGSNGLCSDPDAWWSVSCNSLIDCIYSCNGQCVPANC